MRKNLQHITLKTQKVSPNLNVNNNEIFIAPEGIPFKPNYSKKDIENLEHLNFAAGITPYLRGAYSTMYVTKPWTIKQYYSFYTSKDSNAYYKQNLKNGQKHVSLAYHLAEQQGYHSHNEHIVANIKKTDIAINSVEDIKILFDQIPLDQISVSININSTILPIMAFYIVAAEEQGLKPEQLSGTIQNDLLKEFMLKNPDFHPKKSSMKIISDIFEFTSKNMPLFNSISISGYHIQEAGATSDMELAYTLAYGLEYIRKGLNTGIDIDRFAPRLSFCWGIGMNHFMEIAKMRAARMLWTKLVTPFNPKNPKSLLLRTHSKTSGRSLTAQAPFNNVARTTIEAAAAVFGGTQSLQTNTLPSSLSVRMARNTQLYLQEETQITKTVDPWAGSYFIEKLTADIAEKAWTIIEDIEALGGMTKAIEAGLPKIKIEEASAKKQAKTDSNQDIIVGINKYFLDKEAPISTLEPDNETIKKSQIERLNQTNASRNSKKVKTALENLSQAVQTGNNNLLTLAIEAARERATLGEISNALELG